MRRTTRLTFQIFGADGPCMTWICADTCSSTRRLPAGTVVIGQQPVRSGNLASKFPFSWKTSSARTDEVEERTAADVNSSNRNVRMMASVRGKDVAQREV